MDLATRQKAVDLTEEIMRVYYCNRDIYAVLGHMAADSSWIGPGAREKKYALDGIREYFEAARDAVPSCLLSDVDLRAVDLGENICLVTGSMTISTKPESKLVLEVDQRVSFTYRLEDGVLRVVHMHLSNPYGEMKPEEYFPHEMGSQSYEYLQRLLREKTEVIDMIAGNINGGLKGSNDDSTFSYFYVNEGLPRMLGYTYEEFMEKSGGSAVGAAYPPDVPAAVAECVRCFAEGVVYSVEYRMEKKDGTLIWVLDSGRKNTDSDGITRINSIITDITPLKQALFDLEVERERYRIALENITSAMCEYEIDRDAFTIYYHSEDGTKGVSEREIRPFAQIVREGVTIHPDDGSVFLALCEGEAVGPVEVRTRFLHPDGEWDWSQLSCSVILDAAGGPIRVIGMMKDINEEKRRNQELMDQARRDGLTGLLNQTAVKDAIQAHLLEYPSGSGALFMVDLDRFKEINDSNGHLYGNEVLVKTAEVLQQIGGSTGIAGRTGGDEFILLVETGCPEEVERLAETLVRRVSEIRVDGLISCSVGIAYRLEGEDSFLHLFDRADKALYQAKARGRNRWAIGTGEASFS